MNDPQPIDPRRRIRELQAIPERDRTDAEWDELNELEIRTAPGNRESFDRPSEKRHNPQGQPHGRRPDRNQDRKNTGGQRPAQDARVAQEPRPDARQSQEGRPEGRPPKRQHRRTKRPVETPGNGTA